MNDNLIIAIAGILGTLLAGVITSYATYHFQNKGFEREKKWDQEVREKTRSFDLEDEKRKIRRELLSVKLSVVEEMIMAMAFIMDIEESSELGIPMHSDKLVIKQKKSRIENIFPQAISIVNSTGSELLKKSFHATTNFYWSMEQNEVGWVIGNDQYDKAQQGIVETLRIIDDMKVSAGF